MAVWMRRSDEVASSIEPAKTRRRSRSRAVLTRTSSVERSGLLARASIPDDPGLFLIGEGIVTFERVDRRLRMIVEAEEPNPPPTTRVIHSYRAVLREQGGTVLLDSITLGLPHGRLTEGIDEPDRGVTDAALRALRPSAFADAILQAARSDRAILEVLVERDLGSWIAKAERLAELARVERVTTDRPRQRGGGRVATRGQHLRDVAEVCIAEFASGRRRGFPQLVQNRFGGPKSGRRENCGRLDLPSSERKVARPGCRTRSHRILARPAFPDREVI